MNLVYTSEAETQINVTLDLYEILGNFVGPKVFAVPVAVGNKEYDAIVARKLKVTAYSPPPPTVPSFVTPLQARKILRMLGYLDELESLVAEASPEVQDAWEYATVIERNNPLILEFAEQLDLDDDDLDILFTQASKL